MNYSNLQEAMLQNIGYSFDNLKEDGQWHDGGEVPNKGKCRYIVIQHVKGVIVRYHDHRQGEAYFTWKSWVTDNTRLSPEEYAQRKAEIDAHNARQQAAAALARAQRIAKQRQTWATSQPANPDHPYLVRKQVGAFGIRQHNTALLVPIRDVSGQLQALQYIYPAKVETADGGRTDKIILGSKRGNFHHIGKPETPTDTVYVCEGYATGATLHQLTGQCVVIAFDAGNLTPVGQAIRTRYPESELVFAADNDIGVKAGDIENPGVHYARQAALACNGYVLTPNTTNKADFNDLINEAA
ncbi:toprim domain-containing protein [Thiothrix sp.]|jgi:putative DNA primase/helicase|uniref:toprim domain-containing protein n=1 Tax=Thiothrix sp. TaxID=1032 RepID=UPI00257A6696|nr:toprim domain-containing protein [Thiothrix sp.]